VISSELELEKVHISYGLSHIIFGISLTIGREEIVCLLGRNGVGKTTTLRGIMGLTPPSLGVIKFKGEDITGRPPFVVARTGIGYVPEDRRIFRDLSVFENLKIGRMKGQEKTEGWNLEKVYDLFPGLRERSSHRGSQLSGGEQQMLAIARSLMGNPELLLLDEPSQGLAPILQRKLGNLIKSLKQEGITIFLAEQSLRLALEVSSRVYILEKGTIKFEGTVDEINADESIKSKYLAV
jgi:branched-chain amino acid transport system ATP-binding protein